MTKYLLRQRKKPETYRDWTFVIHRYASQNSCIPWPAFKPIHDVGSLWFYALMYIKIKECSRYRRHTRMHFSNDFIRYVPPGWAHLIYRRLRYIKNTWNMFALMWSYLAHLLLFLIFCNGAPIEKSPDCDNFSFQHSHLSCHAANSAKGSEK